jgi:hypothetical protein
MAAHPNICPYLASLGMPDSRDGSGPPGPGAGEGRSGPPRGDPARPARTVDFGGAVDTAVDTAVTIAGRTNMPVRREKGVPRQIVFRPPFRPTVRIRPSAAQLAVLPVDRVVLALSHHHSCIVCFECW